MSNVLHNVTFPLTMRSPVMLILENDEFAGNVNPLQNVTLLLNTVSP